MHATRLWILAAVALLCASGCDGGGSPCSDGETQQCFCTDGRQGAQSCLADGSAWQECVCTGGGDGDADGDTDGDVEPTGCSAAADCDDGVFCNGEEQCDPDAAGADEEGCVPGDGDPCLEGQTCSEDEDQCLTECDITSDADGDGRDAEECGGDDCDDADAETYPGNVEVCGSSDPDAPDSHDEDCDPATFGPDDDDDGFVRAGCCNEASDGSMSCGDDCNDDNAEINPDAPESCNELDDDCDGVPDDGVQRSFYPDLDGDGFGDATAAAVLACLPPADHVEDNTDCNDGESEQNPGATEACDAIDDNNCDGSNPYDADDDGFDGGCALGPDCDDEHVTVHPGALEVCDDYGDNDCAGTNPHDGDGDGFDDATCGGNDCNDSAAAIYPGAPEVCDLLGDNNCDGASPHDDDADGYDDDTCGGNDCNDSAITVFPGAPEACDLFGDNDCDGASPHDVDGDGFDDGSCGGDDCDDGNGVIYPGAPELCDRLDNDCSSGGGTETAEDVDDDGFAPEDTVLCTGGPLPATDCLDTNPEVRPDQTEWSASPIPGSVDNYDYNCDDMNEPRWSREFVCSNMGGCVYVPGFVREMPLWVVPSCGELRGFPECDPVTCSSSPPYPLIPQECR